MTTSSIKRLQDAQFFRNTGNLKRAFKENTMRYPALAVCILILLASGCGPKPLTGGGSQNNTDSPKPSVAKEAETSDGTKAPKEDWDAIKKVAEELRKMDVGINTPFNGWPTVFIEAKSVTP